MIEILFVKNTIMTLISAFIENTAVNYMLFSVDCFWPFHV